MTYEEEAERVAKIAIGHRDHFKNDVIGIDKYNSEIESYKSIVLNFAKANNTNVMEAAFLISKQNRDNPDEEDFLICAGTELVLDHARMLVLGHAMKVLNNIE